MHSPEDLDHLLHERVAPWVALFPWQATTPVHYDRSEGYRGQGVLGCRAGPSDELHFENLAHELAHAFEILESKGPEEISKPNWGMRITTELEIGGRIFQEAVTFQATQRECRVGGIQKRLLAMVGHPHAEGLENRLADTLLRWMPDWHHGGKDETERLAHRRQLILKSFEEWPEERILGAWPQIFEALEGARQPALKPRRPRP